MSQIEAMREINRLREALQEAREIAIAARVFCRDGNYFPGVPFDEIAAVAEAALRDEIPSELSHDAVVPVEPG